MYVVEAVKALWWNNGVAHNLVLTYNFQCFDSKQFRIQNRKCSFDVRVFVIVSFVLSLDVDIISDNQHLSHWLVDYCL